MIYFINYNADNDDNDTCITNVIFQQNNISDYLL